MAGSAKGGITTETLADNTRFFRLRFRALGKRQTVRLHERRDCDCGCRGGWNERTAAVELENTLARVTAGVWKPPTRAARVSKPANTGSLLFLPYSSKWLQEKIDGVNAEKPIEETTEDYYTWLLELHLLPFFEDYRLDEIDLELCLQFKAYKIRQAKKLREEIAAGADLRNQHGQKIVPLAPSSIRKCIDTLSMILESAAEDKLIPYNPARSKRMKVHVPKPKRTFLETDELAATIDAAAAQDISLSQLPAAGELGLTAAMIAQRFSQGHSAQQISTELRLAKSTVSYHLRRLGLQAGRGYVGRRVVVEILARGGPRASEVCDIKIGHVRVHDPAGARFRIPDSKTETGVRAVEMSADLVEAVIEHIDNLRRRGLPTGPDDYLVPNLHGTRMSYGRVEQIVREAAAGASEKFMARGLPPLPKTTPHTLRRTYVSIALRTSKYDLKWVMGQVGHADSKMTMDVYNQLQQRVKRNYGDDFDAVIREARELSQGTVEPESTPAETSTETASDQVIAKGPESTSTDGDLSGEETQAVANEEAASGGLGGTKTQPSKPSGTATGTARPKRHRKRRQRGTHEVPKNHPLAGSSSMELGGLEPPTSWVRSRRSPN
jgi:integrase